ncbi:hypothetical protein GCK72_011053 [Caenorhabditis remanei]|uniref:DUF281 domain-containing protein n=1 Tax=Caenorhabditis remanei TaxID=31234 RepID=A0A6A5H4J8_CAERE|nr:hypothetical protein GCK72_011053 [Caenorhabditis remanei]KAF1762790.1 hypothetical protein GCK72_011053 [Caenorhabditis remanei]
MILILLFLAFPTVVENCLVVKTVEPPKCECQSLALSTSNILSIIGNHEFYKSNISKYSIHAAKISTDDCNTQMYCEGVYSLVVFDGTEKYHVFGAYSVDGLCDPFTQKWLVDDGSATLTTYGKMQGVCVDYTIKAYTCPCRLYTVDTQNAREMIGPDDSYGRLWSNVELTRPTLPDEECPSTFICPKNTGGVLMVPFYARENDLVSMVISDDRCAWSFGCRRGVAFNGQNRRSDRFEAVCHEDIKKWTIVQQNSTFGEEQIFENQDLFTFACATSY